jgi:hypothetical protein
MIPNSVSLLKLDGEVIHSNDDPTSGPVGMGIRFSGVEPWQLKRLAALLLSRAGYPGLSGRLTQALWKEGVMQSGLKRRVQVHHSMPERDARHLAFYQASDRWVEECLTMELEVELRGVLAEHDREEGWSW